MEGDIKYYIIISYEDSPLSQTKPNFYSPIYRNSFHLLDVRSNLF